MLASNLANTLVNMGSQYGINNLSENNEKEKNTCNY